MQERLDKLLWTLFKVRPIEKGRVFWMALYLMSVVSAIIIGRITRDSLFLTHFSRADLAYNYLTVAFAVSVPLALYSRIADRYRRDRTILVVLVVLAFLLLLSRFGASLNVGWFYFVYYNFIEVFGAFLIIQFWTFASDIFSSREAKRVFPLIGGGGVLANLVSGPPVAAFVDKLGTANLMFVQVGLLGLCMIAVSAVAKSERNRLVEAVSSRRSQQQRRKVKAQGKRAGFIEDFRVVFRSKHLQVVAAITAITFISVQFIDFSFKDVVSRHYQGDELSKFFAYFYAASGIFAALVQFLATRRILERFGVVVALVILPISLLGGALTGALTFGALWAATLAKGTENSLRYSLYDATMQVLYTAVPSDIRGRAKALIDGNLKPIASGFAGGLLLLLVRQFGMPVNQLYWVAMGFIIIWVALVLGLKREYLRQLMATLRKGRLKFDDSQLTIEDTSTLKVLAEALRSSESREVLNALELVPRVRGDGVHAELALCVKHPEREIRLRALHLIAHSESASIQFLDLVHEAFADHDDRVRAEAIRTFCALAGERAIPTVRHFLRDESPLVRSAAVAGLMRYGGLDGILSSADEFKAMLSSGDAKLRKQAAWVLGEIKVRNFFRPVLELMKDKEPRVQIAAIIAAGKMLSTELIPLLVYKLARRETARAAAHALALYGDEVMDILSKVLANRDEERAIRRQIPRILATIGGKKSLQILIDNLGSDDEDLRWRVAREAARLKDRINDAQVAPGLVKPHVLAEIRDYYQMLTSLEDIGGSDYPSGVDLLVDTMRERLARSLDRLFRLLAILYPLRTIDIVHRNLNSNVKIARSNAIELLDNLLEKSLSRLIMPILDEASAQQKIEFGLSACQIEHRSRSEWLNSFLQSEDAWLRVCALYDVGEMGLTNFSAQVETALTDPDPLVRETAVRALSILTTRDSFAQRCQVATKDVDDNVRRYATTLVDVSVASLQQDEGSGSA